MALMQVKRRELYKMYEYCEQHKAQWFVHKDNRGAYIGAEAEGAEPLRYYFLSPATGNAWRKLLRLRFGTDDIHEPLPMAWLERAWANPMLIEVHIRVTGTRLQCEFIYPEMV